MKDNLTNTKDGEYALIVPPTSVRRTGQHALDPGAQAVIERAADTINAFIRAQRQNYARSTLPDHRAFFSSPNIDIQYRNVYGHEIIELTPYPPDVPGSPPPGETPFFIPPETFPTDSPEFPIVTLSKYLLVLYRGSAPDGTKVNLAAAFDMGQLDTPSQIAPFYIGAVPQSTYTQPVVTGQFTFGGIGFIQTDVDLSGKGLAKSVLCTTLFNDAVSLGAQFLPIMNSPVAMNATRPSSVQLYLSPGAAIYDAVAGTFSLGQTVVTTQQPCAIDTSGTYYYGCAYAAPDLVTVAMQKSMIDDGLVQPAIDKAENANSTFVKTYSANTVKKVEEYTDLIFENQISRENFTLNDGQPYVAYLPAGTTTSHDNVTETVYLAATVLPNNDPTYPPGHVNEFLVTEFNGLGYYATATLGKPQSMSMVALAYADTPYYTYSIGSNYYEYVVPSSHAADMFGGTFYAMAYSMGGGIALSAAAIRATATATATITTQSMTQLPDFGGDLYNGETPLTPISTPEPDPGSGSVFAFTMSGDNVIATHTSIAPLGSFMPHGSYQYCEDATASMVAALYQPTPGGNGDPIVQTYTSSSTTTSTTVARSHLDPSLPGPGTTTPSGGLVYDPPIVTTAMSSSPLTINPPGFKVQTLTTSGTATITWLNQTISGSNDSADGNGTVSELDVYPFPPIVNGTPFCISKKQVSVGITTTQTDTVVTPYGPLVGNAFTPWLHVSNPDHFIQGYLVGTTPKLYIDGAQDFMGPLTAALKCAPTDIATMFMDIDLATIQALSKVM